eukprot:4702-Heterococcus_DN1.PRE.5
MKQGSRSIEMGSRKDMKPQMSIDRKTTPDVASAPCLLAAALVACVRRSRVLVKADRRQSSTSRDALVWQPAGLVARPVTQADHCQ